MRCRSNSNLKMSVFEERRKPEYQEKTDNLSYGFIVPGEGRRGRGVLYVMTISGLYWEAPPTRGSHFLSGCRYMKGRENLSFRSVKGLKWANRRILWM